MSHLSLLNRVISPHQNVITVILCIAAFGAVVKAWHFHPCTVVDLREIFHVVVGPMLCGVFSGFLNLTDTRATFLPLHTLVMPVKYVNLQAPAPYSLEDRITPGRGSQAYRKNLKPSYDVFHDLAPGHLSSSICFVGKEQGVLVLKGYTLL